MVSYINFLENYAMKVQNEIQDMHWFSFQITVLVHVFTMWNMSVIAMQYVLSTIMLN
jgi:hypothetical protein